MKTLKIILFYFLSLTWGCVMTTIGLLAALCLIITGHKPQLFHHYIYFEIGKNWGGVNLGPVFLVAKDPTLHIKQHESGHGIQNIVLGPLMPFLVCIPSVVRYWLREMAYKKKLGSFLLSLFAILLIGLVLLIGVSSTGILGASIPMLFLYIYYCIIYIWTASTEGPKYEKQNWPEYDAIWFEGSATKLGEKYFS